MPTYYIMDLGKGMAETAAEEMPSAQGVASCKWLTEDELDVYASEFGRTGFQGGLQWYRCLVGKYTAELEMFSGRTIDVPACYIAGKSDWASTKIQVPLRECKPRHALNGEALIWSMVRDIGYNRSSRRKSAACFCNSYNDKNFRSGSHPDFLLGGRTSVSAECRHWSARAVSWSS